MVKWFESANRKNVPVATAILLSAMLLAWLPANVLALTFGPVLDLSDNSPSIDPRIAVDGDNVIVVWDDGSSFPSSIMLKMSTDGGVTFADPEMVSNGADNSASPRVAVIGDNVYVAWVNEDIGSQDIYFRTGTISGDSINFDDEQNISDSLDASNNPQIAVSGSNVYILWEEDLAGYTEIFYAASFDGGVDFIQNNLSNSTFVYSTSVQVVASGDDAFITWSENDSDGTGFSDAYFIKGTTDVASISFSGPTPLSTALDGAGGFAFNPKIAVSGANVHVVWQDAFLLDIFYATSIDGGDSFDTPVDETDNNISSNNNSREPDIFALNDEAYIVWVNDNEGSGDVFFNKGIISGSDLSFEGEIPIDGEAEISAEPVISVSDTNVYVTWKWNDFPSEVFASVSTDSGSNFGTVNLSNNGGDSFSPRVASSASKGFVVWQDDVNGDYDVLIRTIEETGPPSITIESVSDTSPRWDLDPVIISGFVNGNGTDTISIDWDDGNVTSDLAVDGADWGPFTHYYDSANTGPKTIVVTLLNETDFEMDSVTADITVQKHATSLTIDPIFSVVEGTDISVTGVLTDTDESAPIDGADITFNGTGSGGLPTAVTIADGSYSETGASPSSVDELLTVQAHFAGDTSYNASDSEIEGYDTVAVGTAEFAVLAGSPSGPIDLTGFDASIIFDNVLSDGSIFVSACSSPASARYEPMTADQCIKISPAVELDPDFAANLTIMFDESDIPAGFSIEGIDLFHEGLSGITDITTERDEDASIVTGTITDFSNFIVGAAVHDDAPAGASRQQVFVGDNDLLFNFTATKEIALDDEEYSIGETVTLNVTDPSQNLDDSSVDSIEATVNSTSDQTGITVDLLESGVDTNVFEGTFTLTSGSSSTVNAELSVEDGDDIEATYEEYTRAPFRIIIEGVSESGLIELVDYDPPVRTNLEPVGDAYELSLIDASIQDAEITVTMSYSNVEDFLGDDPAAIHMLRMDGVDCQEVMDLSEDLDEETVTGNTTEIGQYTMVFSDLNPPGQCPPLGGGSAGGLPRPGTGGLLLDSALIAGSIEDSEDETSSESNSGGGGGANRVVVVKNEPIEDDISDAPVETFPESHFEENPLDRVEVSSTGFMDTDGNDVSEASIGQQISIASTFSNHQQESQKYSFIIVIIDEDGFAVDVAWQEGTVESGQTVDLSISWMPQDGGNYTVKMFVWDSLDNPTPLSNATVNNISVL